MENPATWSDDAKAINAAICEYERQVAQGIIGHSLVRVIEDNVVVELRERIRMLSDIALSAICLKLNIEHGFPPRMDALDRDLAAYSKKFGRVIMQQSETPAASAPVCSRCGQPIRSGDAVDQQGGPHVYCPVPAIQVMPEEAAERQK